VQGQAKQAEVQDAQPLELQGALHSAPSDVALAALNFFCARPKEGLEFFFVGF
jgi:hypothetical protein